MRNTIRDMAEIDDEFYDTITNFLSSLISALSRIALRI